jgi:hypothetical protein
VRPPAARAGGHPLSLLGPRHSTSGPDRPQPLRPGPTLVGSLAALAFGSLVLGSICAAPSNMVGRMSAGLFWLVLAAIWGAMAACIYAANQAWLGRDNSERFEVFLLCLGIALVVFLVMLVMLAQIPGLGLQH